MAATIGKWLVLLGLGIIVIGLIFWIGSKLGLGKLPGDFQIQKENWGFYFPFATSIIISIVLTLLINFFLWLYRK